MRGGTPAEANPRIRARGVRPCFLTAASEARTIEVKPSIAAKIYDAQIAGFSGDGAWSPAAIDVIRHSLKELGILGAVPEAKAIYNDQFVPVRF